MVNLFNINLGEHKMKLTKSKLKEIIREEIQQLNEAEYTQTYKSIKDMDKDRNRIWTITGYPRVNISFIQ